LRLEPQYADCLSGRGHAYYLAEDYERAVADFTAAIKVDGKNPDYYRNRARAYKAQGEREKARADRQKVAALAPAAESAGTESDAVAAGQQLDQRVTLADLIAAGLLRAPLGLFRRYKGQTLEATLQPDGLVGFQGQVYD